MYTQEQAFVEGFMKRAAEHGVAPGLAKEALFGNPAYTGLDDSKTDPRIQGGAGVGAHLKRNSGKYVNGTLNGLGGGLLGLLTAAASGGKLHHGAGIGALIGGLGGTLTGGIEDHQLKRKSEQDAMRAEVIKNRGGGAGYEPDQHAGSGNLVGAGLLGTLGAGLLAAKLAPGLASKARTAATNFARRGTQVVTGAGDIAKSNAARPLIRQLGYGA